MATCRKVQLPFCCQDETANEWIVPVIQGYVQTALCEVNYSGSGMNEDMLKQMAAEKFHLILISRRSVSRAGKPDFSEMGLSGIQVHLA